MGLALGCGVYFVIWWITISVVMPFAVQTQSEAGYVVPGSEPGAPVNPRIGTKLLANTALAALVWVVIDVGYIAIYGMDP